MKLRGYQFRSIGLIIMLYLVACATSAPSVPKTPRPTIDPKNSVPLIVASVSMNVRTDKATNLKNFERFMTDAVAQGAHLVVFPEIALQQNPGWGMKYYPIPDEKAYVEKTAETIPGESTDWLTQKAKQSGIYVIFGMTERGDDGKLYNTSVFLGPEGVLARYRKNALWDAQSAGNEELFWKPGADKGMVVDSPLGRIGLMISNELSSDFGRQLGAQDADLIVTISAWPSDYGDMYKQAVVRNADLCDCWHLVSDQFGLRGHGISYGHSMIVDPDGNVIADTGFDERMVVAKTGVSIDSRTLPSNRRP